MILLKKVAFTFHGREVWQDFVIARSPHAVYLGLKIESFVVVVVQSAASGSRKLRKEPA